MTTETRTCQNCKNPFTVEPEDFVFYNRIKVPPPTWCPECRLIRRLVCRNERSLYRRQCQAPGHTETVISFIAPEKPYVIYDQKYWWSDAWDATEYGQDYDFSRPFFGQFAELRRHVPVACLSSDYTTLINSEYVNWSGQCRNCYLVTDADYVENSAYSSSIFKVKECFDCDNALESELCYDCFDLEKCYRMIGSYNCNGCADVLFSMNCSACTNCFGCVNLRGKSYHILNEPYSKEDYAKKVGELYNGSYETYSSAFAAMVERSRGYPRKFMRGFMNRNVSGDYLYNSKNVACGFLATDVEDSKFVALTHCPGTKNCYDYTDWGENVQLLYECMTCGAGVANSKFSWGLVKDSRDSSYSYFSINCSNIFGCVGLNKKQYCILNKRYTKEEYEALVPRIIKHMDEMPYVDRKGRVYGYGEFFPPDVSQFAYNETAAQEFFPLTKDEALTHGFTWRDPDPRNYTITKRTEELPQTIAKVDDAFTDEVIECSHRAQCDHNCPGAFRIIPDELRFYRRLNLPVPRLCPNCRHYGRLAFRNPMRLWHRACQCAGTASSSGTYRNATTHFHREGKCPNEFETSYAPDRKEIVYCEQCYNAEVA